VHHVEAVEGGLGRFFALLQSFGRSSPPAAPIMSYSEGKPGKNVSRETVLSDRGRKPYKRAYAARACDMWDGAENW